MKKLYILSFLTLFSNMLIAQSLELKGVIVFESGGSQGKALHLFVNADIPDLSFYGVGVANNGGGTDGIEYQFPVQAVSAGSHIFLPRNTTWMTNYFINLDVFDFVIETGLATQNGDDAVELFDNVVPDGVGGWIGSVIETFGDLNCAPSSDGTTTTCPSFQYYGNSWAYKESGVWTYGGIDCTGTGTVNTANTQTSSCPYPFADSTLSNKDFSKTELSIYPNPVNNGIVNINSSLSGVKNIQLYDIMGRQVLNTKLTSDVLDVSSVHSGLYLLRISIDDRSSTTKLIIE
jgi:hypothetical protein